VVAANWSTEAVKPERDKLVAIIGTTINERSIDDVYVELIGSGCAPEELMVG
jgi:hypothetical protein